MKKNTINFILNAIQFFLIGGVVSLLFLIYLVKFDAYFYKLDFKEEGFNNKIEKYFLFTIYIPLIILFIFSVVKIIQTNSIKEKISITLSNFLGIVMFVAIDRIIKKFVIIYPDNILLNLTFYVIIYSVLIYITNKLLKKFKVG